jgi:hypothetical protein
MIYGPKRNTFLVGKWKSSYRLISPFRHAISLFEMPTFFLEECQFGHKRPFFVILVIAKNNNTPHLTLATIFARHSIRFYGGMEREKTKSKTKIWHKMGGIDWQALDQHTQGLVHFQIIIFFFIDVDIIFLDKKAGVVQSCGFLLFPSLDSRAMRTSKAN